MTNLQHAGMTNLHGGGDVNIAESFVRLAGQWPDRMAILSPGLTLTYGEVVARAARSARQLRSLDVKPGDNVGIATRDSGEATVLMLALWLLGAVPVPIDFRTRSTERALLAGEFNLTAILEDRQISEADRYPSIRVDNTWTEVISKHNGTPVFEGSRQPPAIISLTSGTTGRPAGIVIGHAQLLFRFATNLKLGRRRPGGRLLSPLPMSSSGPRNSSLSQLLDGGTVFFHPPLFSPGELLEATLSQAVTRLCIVPTILRGLLELRGDGGSPLLAPLDALYCFGAPTLPEEKRRARSELSENLVEGYSSSLSGRISVLCGDDIDARPETVGRVLPHVELEIVDDSDEPLSKGEAGTIRVRSPAMARTIYGDNARKSGDKLRGGWAYPGDIGALGDDGFLRLLGRTSDLIIRGGANVHPSEVERVIAEHEGVQEVAVVGFTKLPEGEEIAAFVVPTPNLTEAALIAHCRARLAPDKRPRKLVFVRDLPRNANGKVLRAELRRQLESGN